MTSQTAIHTVKRRMELLDEAIETPLQAVFKKLSEKYHVSEASVRNDWNSRETWIKDIIKLDDPTLGQRYFLGLEKVIREAWFMHKNALTEGTKATALRLVKDTYGLLIDTLVKAGYISKEEALSGYEEIKISWLSHKPVSPGIVSTRAPVSTDKPQHKNNKTTGGTK